MKKFHIKPILIFLIYVLYSLTFINCFPCPSECICKPTGTIDEDFKRMRYIIDCTNVILNNNKLIYQAQSWSIIKDIIVDDSDDHTDNEYIISIDLSNSSSLKEFNNQTIELSNFSFEVESLSLTNQPKDFLLQLNSFNSNLYQNLKILNLSSCCQRIPINCPKLFHPLKQLEQLDLSGSDMYKTCLSLDTISHTLRDLILRNNNYYSNTFSHSSEIFNGVRMISGKLDLQNSRFNMSTHSTGNCLFDLFTRITILDLSFVQFISDSNDTEPHLAHFISCKKSANKDLEGKQLVELYLRQLNLQYLPDWFTNERFPALTHLDLSNNNIRSINLQQFATLKSISLAYNPIEIRGIQWRPDKIYDSINLRSIIINQTLSLTRTIEYLFQYSTDIDYSENPGLIASNLTKFSTRNDFLPVSLNLSQTNLYSFDIQDISIFDNLFRLDLSSNNLTGLNLDKQSNLKYLDCSNQKLNKLIMNKDSSNLIEIKCSNNSLKTIENLLLFKHESLQLIDLSYNSIESLENLFSNLNNRYLQIVNFKSNLIKKISSNLFHDKLFSLYSIDLSWNRINLIEKSAFQLPNLQILDLTGNQLKSIETKFLFTSSLRLFYIINNTQQLITRCAQSKSDDNLLLTYITWFEQNGTYMKNTQKEKSEQIQLDKCLRGYISRSKVKWVKVNEKYQFKHLSLYVTMAAISVGVILGGIYLYKKNQWRFFRSFQRYRPLERNNLIEYRDEFSHHQREDDEIVMNLDEPPFNAINRS